MDIPRDLRPADPPLRKRPADAAGKAAGPEQTPRARAADSSSHAQSVAGDQATFTSADAISRYVDVLKSVNPTSLHKVEDLRTRIADGTYRADPEELADMLLGGSPRPATSKPPSGRPG